MNRGVSRLSFRCLPVKVALTWEDHGSYLVFLKGGEDEGVGSVDDLEGWLLIGRLRTIGVVGFTGETPVLLDVAARSRV